MPKIKEKKPTKKIEVDDDELMEYLGLSERRIRVLANDKIIFKTAPATYDLKKSVRGYIDYTRSLKKEEAQGIEKIRIAREAEGLMHDKLKKRKTELQIMQIEKKVLLTDDVVNMWGDFAAAVKSKLLNLPTKVSPQIAGLQDVKEIKKMLNQEVIEALNEIANFDINKFDSGYILADDESEVDNTNGRGTEE